MPSCRAKGGLGVDDLPLDLPADLHADSFVRRAVAG